MRLLAGLPVSREDITGMGVGGLLMEIVTRPQPRAEPAPEKAASAIAAVVLAAGRSTRMGAVNKLLAEIGGKPLVRIAAEQALASRAEPVIVVTGHRARQGRSGARRARRAAACTIRITPRASAPRCKAGIAAVPDDADGAIVCLGDMPQVDAGADRQADRGVRSRARRAGGGADHRGQARQSGGLGAALLPRSDGDRGRHRRPPSDRPLPRGGRRSAGRRRARR